MNQYRVTKYNPALRNSAGIYARDGWTSFDDVGRSFDGVLLTKAEYERIEDAYIEAAIAFLQEAAIPCLTVRALENARGLPTLFAEGDALSLAQVSAALRSLLREECWCLLESRAAFVHVGWDYYMYLGVPHPARTGRTKAVGLGLFVEEFASPYRDGSGTD